MSKDNGSVGVHTGQPNSNTEAARQDTSAQVLAQKNRISYLVAAGFVFVFIASMGFGSAMVYSMARLKSTTQNVYLRSATINEAALGVFASLSRMHTLMMNILTSDDQDRIALQGMEMQTLSQELRTDFAIIKTVLPPDSPEVMSIEQGMDSWLAFRNQLIELVKHKHKQEALALAVDNSGKIYGQLQSSMDQVITEAQHHVISLAATAKDEADSLISLAWWFLCGLVLSCAFFGYAIVRKTSAILAHEQCTANRLFESEERLKLALSGANEATWDLDVPNGRLSFDTKWGEILGYEEKRRPIYFEEWSALIHPDDRERVLKAMDDHISGTTSEYRAEYRIRSATGTMKWVAGHGKAVSRDRNGKAIRVVGVTRDITLTKQAEAQIWQLAHTDFLTGLPNRISFYDRLGQSLAHARRHDKKLALLFMDLDGFKQTNDQYGHDTGDGLLQEVARRLQQCVRGEDTVARTGGDEFIFILNNIALPENAATVASKVIHSLDGPITIRGNTCQIGTSIGISIYPDDTLDLESLVSFADSAMYCAKTGGKGVYQFYSSMPRTTQPH